MLDDDAGRRRSLRDRRLRRRRPARAPVVAQVRAARLRHPVGAAHRPVVGVVIIIIITTALFFFFCEKAVDGD